MSDQFTLLGKAGSCASDYGRYSFLPVLRNTTGTRVCGIQLYNASEAMAPCCSGDVQVYWCNSYCATDMNTASFEQCYLNNTRKLQGTSSNVSVAGNPGTVYCQSGINSSYTQSNDDASTSSGALRAPAPNPRLLSTLLLAGLLFLLLATPASASAVHDDGDLARRADDDSAGCTFAVDQNYTTLGQARIVSASFDGAFLAVGVPVSVPDNNRTLNGSSAADPQYDDFFGVVGNATGGRRFPATTGLEMFFEWTTNGQMTYLQFIPMLVSC